VVYAQPAKDGKHTSLDGRLRRASLLDMGQAEAPCILARDDEAFTYNKRVNPVAPVQEHLMIMRALERGISGSEAGADLECQYCAYQAASCLAQRHLPGGRPVAEGQARQSGDL
jgi:hypothetical protein